MAQPWILNEARPSGQDDTGMRMSSDMEAYSDACVNIYIYIYIYVCSQTVPHICTCTYPKGMNKLSQLPEPHACIHSKYPPAPFVETPGCEISGTYVWFLDFGSWDELRIPLNPPVQPKKR